MNLQSATSHDEAPTPKRTRPTTGYALSLVITGDAVDGVQISASIAELGAEVRSSAPIDGGLEVFVACSGTAQQSDVLEMLGKLSGVDSVCSSDTTFDLHVGGKIVVSPRTALVGPDELAMAYTPGVGRVSTHIAQEPSSVWRFTGRSNAVAVLSNGTAVLGLGDIGPEAAMPVMEGKAVLFKQFGGVDAYPVCVNAPTVDEVVAVGAAIAPTFGGINLEDIKAPECFEIEERLQEMLDIPIFHDDQHGTAIVVVAALLNAAKVIGRSMSELTVTIVGTGAAGVACAHLLAEIGVGDIIGVDSRGILDSSRDGLHPSKQWFVDNGNKNNRSGGAREAIEGADVLIGLSGPGIIEPEWVASMGDNAIVFALANPVPEIMPELMPDNVAVVATGRSDYPNQINNVLAFPGVFRGLLDVRATNASMGVKRAAAEALAAMVGEPTAERVIPGAFEDGVADIVARSVSAQARAEGLAREAVAG
ncbi:MAG: NAD(P)-dependent malic enzyme [Ilumatobacteraceae bacterium]